MKNKLGRKIVFAITTLVLSGLSGLSSSSTLYAAQKDADLVWDRCGAISTDSIFYYECAKSVLNLSGELTKSDVQSGSKLSQILGGEEARGNFSFAKADQLFDENQTLTELDREAQNCTKDASGWGWFACSFSKKANELTSFIYPIIQASMSTDPEIFKSQTMEQAWGRFRVIADIVLIGMIFVMIISQITGLGISNYGVKKALPRIIIAAIVINLSFILCRVAIDVVNIIGDGIGSVFEGLADSAKAKIDYDILPDTKSANRIFKAKLSGGTVVTGIAGFFAAKSALASGQSIILLIMTAGIAALVGFLLLVIIIQVRKALIILLTITSPVAFLLYILPGTKKLFNSWFGLFKGLLFAYPLCSLFVTGGAFASTIILAAMGVGDSSGSINFFALVISLAASVVPIFLIPRTIIQSAGAIGAKLQGLARRLTGFASKALGSSRLGRALDRGAKERANRIRAGVNRNGNETRWSRLNRSHNERIRTDALKRAQADRALRRAEGNAVEMAEYEDMEQQVKDTEERLAGVNEKGMEAEMKDIINNGFADGTSARDIAAQVAGAVNHWNSVDAKNDADSAIAEALDSLSGQGDDARAQEIRREIARRRLADSDGMLKAKHGAMRQYYRTQAANATPAAGQEKWNGGEVDKDGKNNKPIYEHNQWVDKLVNSNDFTAEWLAGVAPPQIDQLRRYMEASDTSVETKRRIAQTYDNMKNISAYQGATASDYDDLEAAIYNFRNPPAP